MTDFPIFVELHWISYYRKVCDDLRHLAKWFLLQLFPRPKMGYLIVLYSILNKKNFKTDLKTIIMENYRDPSQWSPPCILTLRTWKHWSVESQRDYCSSKQDMAILQSTSFVLSMVLSSKSSWIHSFTPWNNGLYWPVGSINIYLETPEEGLFCFVLFYFVFPCGLRKRSLLLLVSQTSSD